jgi:predicted DNA-binding protein
MYSPKIAEKHIPILYQLGKQFKKPMTYLVNEAVTEYLTKVSDVALAPNISA